MSRDDQTDRWEEDQQRAQKRAGVPPSVSSVELLQGGNELLIEHGSEVYRLRLTRQGKLILHK